MYLVYRSKQEVVDVKKSSYGHNERQKMTQRDIQTHYCNYTCHVRDSKTQPQF